MRNGSINPAILLLRIAVAVVLGSVSLQCGTALAQGLGQSDHMSALFDSHDISGYWELGEDGKSIPPANLAPGVTKAMLDKVAREDLISYRWCRPLGLPALMDNGRPLDIEQGRWEVLMTMEADAAPRHLYLNREHVNPDIFDPSSVGGSVAHWDEDTLVVDTVGFHGKNGRLAIPGGGFRTENSHLVEKYKLLKHGNVLSVTFTWTDPRVFKTPHTYEFRYTKVQGKYEPRPAIGCDPYDPERTEFVTRTFSPPVKAAADAAMVSPGTQVK